MFLCMKHDFHDDWTVDVRETCALNDRSMKEEEVDRGDGVVMVEQAGGGGGNN